MPALIFVNGKVSIGHILVGYLGIAAARRGLASPSGSSPRRSRERRSSPPFSGRRSSGVLLLFWMAAKVDRPAGQHVPRCRWRIHPRAPAGFMTGVLKLENVVFYIAVDLLLPARRDQDAGGTPMEVRERSRLRCPSLVYAERLVADVPGRARFLDHQRRAHDALAGAVRPGRRPTWCSGSKGASSETGDRKADRKMLAVFAFLTVLGARRSGSRPPRRARSSSRIAKASTEAQRQVRDASPPSPGSRSSPISAIPLLFAERALYPMRRAENIEGGACCRPKPRASRWPSRPSTARSSRTRRASSTARPTFRTSAPRARANRPRTSSRASRIRSRSPIFFPQLNDVGSRGGRVPERARPRVARSSSRGARPAARAGARQGLEGHPGRRASCSPAGRHKRR